VDVGGDLEVLSFGIIEERESRNYNLPRRK
jgi:hypothetical protein